MHQTILRRTARGILAALVALAFGWPLAGPAAARDLTAEEGAIVALLDEYVTSFQTREAVEIAGYYHAPSSVIWSGGVLTLTRPIDILRFIESQKQAIAARDLARSEWTDLRIKQMSATLAVVSTAVVRYSSDGTELDRAGATYALRKTETGWKIAMLMIHDESAVLDLD
ncbi:MAG: hypothetical protein QF827_00930 [Alphaproteobacteria bacterium]|nr:hypothetical protein [Alphaproteobacteria bacterium]